MKRSVILNLEPFLGIRDRSKDQDRIGTNVLIDHMLGSSRQGHFDRRQRYERLGQSMCGQLDLMVQFELLNLTDDWYQHVHSWSQLWIQLDDCEQHGQQCDPFDLVHGGDGLDSQESVRQDGDDENVHGALLGYLQPLVSCLCSNATRFFVKIFRPFFSMVNFFISFKNMYKK